MNLPYLPPSMAGLNASAFASTLWCSQQKGLPGSQSLLHTHSPDRQQDSKISVELLPDQTLGGGENTADYPGQIKKSLSRKTRKV